MPVPRRVDASGKKTHPSSSWPAFVRLPSPKWPISPSPWPQLDAESWRPGMTPPTPPCVDTVIVGNGPSALILSYILHGHVPYYVGGHHDPILDSKLSQRPCLLNLTPDLYTHFLSSLRYSTQALPINTLLDTLIRPNADTEINPTSCIEWRYEPARAVSHVAIGQTAQPGGQWADNPVSASADIGTLSYAEQLSLPGYSYADHVAKSGKKGQCDFVRPSRTEVAEYLKAYPKAVGIADAVYTQLKVEDVYRSGNGFVVGSLGIRCKHLVLASGTFTVNIPPTPVLAPIAQLDNPQEPLLVIGSGFSAADVIISAPSTRKIIHIFQWTPDTRPSPLRGCHHTAYPEYATVYRQMKLAAIASLKSTPARSPMLRRKSNPFFMQRDWTTYYEGLANACVESVSCPEDAHTATITIRLASGELISRSVGGLQYVIGRRGTLDFLSPDLRAEVLGTHASPTEPTLISGHTLRAKSESSLEVADNVFVIGSLAGDSLIRHAVGGCVFAAGRIMGALPSGLSSTASSSSASSSRSESPVHGCDASVTSYDSVPQSSVLSEREPRTANGHSDLHVDRRELAREVERISAVNSAWVESGWWGGGLGMGTGGR